MVLHGNELASSSSSSEAPTSASSPTKVFIVAVATVQVVAAKVVGIVAKSAVAVDSRVARTARTVVDVVDVAKVVVVAVDVVVGVVTTIYTGAVVEQLAVTRAVLVEHERTAGEIVHRFGPRLGRRVQVEERRLAVLEPVGMGHKLAPRAATGHAVLGR